MVQTRTQSRLDFGSAGNWNAIEARAREFVDRWDDATYEKGQSQPFWIDFLSVFGIDHKRAGAYFEYPQLKLNDKQGFIDLFWPGKLVAEQKSAGRNLARAREQALDYLPKMLDKDLPQGVIVSDFRTFDLLRLDTGVSTTFSLQELPDKVRLFTFLLDKQDYTDIDLGPVNVRAAQDISRLHLELDRLGYRGRDLELFLTRVVFCLFAEDTGIFDRGQFSNYVRNYTADNGADTGRVLNELFEVLDKAPANRQQNLPDILKAFPYVNGGLFADRIGTAVLDTESRRAILTASQSNWAEVNPSIFGSMFQGIMDEGQRRNLGAHYTSEKNILRLIQPLFLDDLYSEFNDAIGSRDRLARLHDKIANLTFLDPACGSGNFLVITFRELRRLEHKLIQETVRGRQFLPMDVAHLIRVTPDQMYGIELEEFPAKVAQLALWLTEHQMNREAAALFGGSLDAYAKVPIESTPHIVNTNALTTDWGDVVELSNLDYIIGNPPFIGQTYQTSEQKEQVAAVLTGIARTGVLDFVTAWYGKAVDAMTRNPKILTALVATNSITQGEQASILWSYLFKHEVTINFGHRTFKWSNDASGVANVFCVIVGFGLRATKPKRIFDYEGPTSEPVESLATNVNQYLLDAPSTIVANRSFPISDVAAMAWGNKPTDGGYLILSETEREQVLMSEPDIAQYIKRYMGGRDMINTEVRYCLWLADASPKTTRSSAFLTARVGAVQEFRKQSRARSTRDFAAYPTLFRQVSQPKVPYLAIPEVSSERRDYVPMAFYSQDVIASNTIQFIAGATTYHFGILTSNMHMAWMRTVAGRLKGDYRYSKDIVYNNFPWPENVTDAQRAKIERLAQAVLDARTAHPTSTLADLYDPLAMPANLRQAHTNLDRSVDRLYRSKPFADDAERVAMLLKMYQRLTA